MRKAASLPLHPATLGLLLLAGCAPMQPIPFQLLERGQTYQGTFQPGERRLDAQIGDKHYSGFYILESGTAYSQGWWPRRGFPSDTVTTYTTNSARATLTAPDGDRLFCEFVFEGSRALGECKSLDGKAYRLLSESR